MRSAGWLLSGAAAMGLFAASQAAVANEGLLVMQENPAYWPMPLRDYSSTRFSELAQINKDNVGDLQVAWTFSTGVLRGHEGGPLVIGNVMYIHTPFPNIVYALDLNDNGRVIWKYEPKQDPDVIPVMCCDTVNRGVAYADGKIFLHQADTTLVALDAETGEVQWTAVNGDPKKGETGTSAPMIIGDKVLVGISGGEFGVQGHVTAYNVENGELVWRGRLDRSRRSDPDGSPEHHPSRPAGRCRTRVRRPGKAISGRSAAARPGAGCPTIPTSIWSTTAPAIPRPGTRCSGRATTGGR